MTNATQSRRQNAGRVGTLRLLCNNLVTFVHRQRHPLHRTLAEKVVAWCDLQLLFL